METLHRLAGVQDASDLSSSHPAAQPVSTLSEHAPPPLPKDSDDPNAPPPSQRASRASLPLNRKSSHKSFKSKSGSRRNSQSRSRKNSLSRKSSDQGRLPADYPPTPRVDNLDFSAFTSSQPLPAAPQQQPQEDIRPSAESDVRSAHSGAGEGESGAEEEEEEEEDDDDFTWGPTHPCFPHPNPHVSPMSSEYASTRVIRVRRDYLTVGDMFPQFANLYPEILDPLVTEAEFRDLILTLNKLCRAAYAPCTQWAWIDALLGAFTGFIWDDLGLTHAKKGEKAIERFIDEWNWDKQREKKEVSVVQCRRTAFMSLDFVVPDPGIDAVRDGVIEEEEGEGTVGEQKEGVGA